METITIILIIITITIIAFTSVNISYKSGGTTITKPTTLVEKTVANSTNVGKFNPYASSHALYNLPAKDQYMSQEFRDQIDKLRTQYYYNNCASGSSAK
jgi:hypothetical protein